MSLTKWFKEEWVRIGSDGSILGSCGKKEAQSNPARCLPRAKAEALSKKERAATAKKKKAAGAKGKTVVPNTAKAKVRRRTSKKRA